MTRRTYKIKIGDKRNRYRTIIEDPGTGDPNESFSYRLKLLFKSISENPDLLLCGLLTPKAIKMYHNGDGWIIEAEAEGE